METIRHRSTENKVLFDYNKVSSLPVGKDRVIFLSERDYYILLNSIEHIGKFRKRVYTAYSGEVYTICTDEQWYNFQWAVEDLETSLGGWIMSNEFLERIAIATEAIQLSVASLDEKAQTYITWQEILDDLADSLGVGNAFYLLIKAFTDLVPSIKNVKLDPWPMITALWRTKTFEAPLLAGILGMNASLGTIAATGVGEAIANKLKTLMDGISLLNDYYNQMRTGLIGDWNVLDFLDSVWNWFLSDGEGGEGGEDPDNDPTIRTDVNVSNNIINNQDLICSPVINVSGSGGCCTMSGGDDVTSVLDGPIVTTPDRETEDPPSNIPTWEEFDVQKCNSVGVFLSQFKDTLRNWGGMAGFVGGLTIAVIVGITLLTIPPVGLTLLLASMAAILTINSAGFVYFITIAEFIEDIEGEILCELYEVDNSDSARTIMQGHITDAIASLVGAELFASALEAACNTLLYNSSLGKIYDGSMIIPEGTSVDCSECEEEEEDYWYLDSPAGQPLPTLVSGSLQNSAIIQSAFGVMFGASRHYIILTATGDPQESGFNIDAIVNAGGEPVTLDVYDISLSQTYTSGNVTFAALVGENHRGRQIHIYSQTLDDNSFTIEFEVSD
jgi:hypothetical protein